MVKSDRLLGTTMALTGIVAFSAKAVLVKLCYRYQVPVVSVLLLRMLMALPFYVVIGIVDARKHNYAPMQGKDMMWLFILGFVGYYLSSFLDFSGLQYIEAGLERIILFIYPTIVVLISALLLKKSIGGNHIIAIVLTYLGVIVAFSGKVSFHAGHDVWLGVILIFMCAVTYASYLAGSGQLIPRLGSVRFTTYAMLIASGCVILHYLFTEQFKLFSFHPMVYVYALIMATMSTVLPSYLISGAIQRIGAAHTSVLGSVGPFSTIILAYIFLNETITVYQLVGTCIVIAGIVILNRK
jgi:drug/metabolite transporter (DMT)-like permease